MADYRKPVLWKQPSPCCKYPMKSLTMAHTALKCLKCGKVYFANEGKLKEMKT